MFRPSTSSDLEALLNFTQPDPVPWVDATSYLAGRRTFTYRDDWTWLVEVDGTPIARAIWWGPADSPFPHDLHCLIVDASVPHPEFVAAALLRSAYREFALAGAPVVSTSTVDEYVAERFSRLATV